jgi:phosphate transport system protein
MATHALKPFDRDLDQLRALISEMGGLAEHALRESRPWRLHPPHEGARQVVEDDRKLDSLEAQAEERALRLIALRAPHAGDVRDVAAALKIVGVVERIGDYAKNIAKRAPELAGADRIDALSLLAEMARIAAEMVHDALNAYVERDPGKARAVCERDRIVDDFYDSIFRALLTFMMEDPQNISRSAHLLFVAKNIERIGDHATNIAEMVFFAATGERLPERPRGGESGGSG